MADKPRPLQDIFLNECRRSKTSVTIFLMKGVKLQGVITWFDAFSLLLRRDGSAQLVYKHAISTIMPLHAVKLETTEDGEGKGAPGLQQLFLTAAEREAQQMTVFLVNGVMLQGKLAGHDQFVLMLERGGQTQMVYKHAISTVQPERSLNLGSDAEGEGH